MTQESSSAVNLEVGWGEGKEEDFSELHEAIAQGRAKKQTGLEGSSSSDEEEDLVEPPQNQPGLRLLWAAQTNNEKVADEILSENPALISFQDEDGYTALHRACYSNHPSLTQRLITKYGADLHALTTECWTPLHSAC